MAVVCFLVFGFNLIVCAKLPARIAYRDLKKQNLFNIRGIAHVQPHTIQVGWEWDLLHFGMKQKGMDQVDEGDVAGRDLNRVFPVLGGSSACERLPEVGGPVTGLFPCTIPGVYVPAAGASRTGACHTGSRDGVPSRGIADYTRKAETYMLFEEVVNKTNLVVYNGQVWDVSRMLTEQPNFLGQDVAALLRANFGKDISRKLARLPKGREYGACLDELFRIASIDADPIGCIVYNIVFYVSFTIIIGILGARFFLAVFFRVVIGWKNGINRDGTRGKRDLQRRRTEFASLGRGKVNGNEVQLGEQQGAVEIRLEHVSRDQKPELVNRKIAGTPPPQRSASPMRASQFIRTPSTGGLPAHLNRTPSSHSNKSSPSRGPQANPNDPVMTPDGQMREPTLPGIQLTEQDFAPPSPTPPSTTGSEPDWTGNKYLDPALAAQYVNADPVLNDPTLLHTLVMVPAYSEGAASLCATLDSVAHSYYPSTHKTLFVIADGIVEGVGNEATTPDLLINMMEVDERFKEDDPKWGGEPKAMSYVAIADGSKRKNYAKVYAGWYRYAMKTDDQQEQQKKKKKGGLFSRNNASEEWATMPEGQDMDDAPTGLPQRSMTMRTIRNRKEGKIPMILVVKCGNEEERDPNTKAAKPGNRGKRDSQVLLMQFLTKVLFDDRMTELEFDIFHKLWTITGLHPERYEAVLMVDADTRIYPDAITHMVSSMIQDPRIFGLCGETKVFNKWTSWVTMIQVFEYYISHHLSKAFESVFGGVTCLPGCFSMYRIKAPKGEMGYYVPLLANPDVCEEYSENVVDTLHKKNLLLLGEDRYLTTLMLRTFPKRRSVFVPQAICKTVVPDSFSVLLSQRRRWINSTIHNLLELVLVRDLCGTFCISMQFVIFMDLIATVVLPAALISLIYVIISLAKTFQADSLAHTSQIMALALACAVLGLPAILIVLTASRLIYVLWMLIYLCALPVWQFILPLYAFWHMDDFTWGQTRKTSGDVKGEDHSRREGEFDGTGINMRRWSEWVRERSEQEERKKGGKGYGGMKKLDRLTWVGMGAPGAQVGAPWSGPPGGPHSIFAPYAPQMQMMTGGPPMYPPGMYGGRPIPVEMPDEDTAEPARSEAKFDHGGKFTHG
ncbi:Chitin synthase, class 3 [Rhizophlyctis rosea]|nr:Chitin synthase, class 3 [Rhizophlyctis rosea]